MHEDINRVAREAGLNPEKVFALASQLANPARTDRMRGMVSYPKPSGTKERRKAERQNKKKGRQAARTRK